MLYPRWVAWHLFVAGSIWGMLALGDWQLHRAESGNSLSWAYTFEWPFFAIMAVVFWVKTLRDEANPREAPGTEPEVPLPAGASAPAKVNAGAVPAADGEASDEDQELAAYNAYLARLHQEVKGHGRWHGFR